MSQPRGTETFVTPEAIPIVLDLAGVGSRTIATLIDALIEFAVFFAVAFLLSSAGVGQDLAGVVLLVTFFVLIWGYYIALEGLWGGRTPGKAAAKIRVVRADGRPVTWTQVTVRNLLRIIDFLPVYYVLGGILVVLTKRSQRLGDLAAGTVVVRDRPARSPAVLPISPDVAAAARTLDTSAISDREFSLIRSFLERRATLVAASRATVAHELASMVRPRVAGADRWTSDEESLLEAVAASYRARLSSTDGLPSPP